MRKSYSLTSIIGTIVVLSFALIVVPLSYFSHVNFQKTLEDNISNYLDQVQNSTETIFEHEAFLVSNKAKEISKHIANVGLNNLQDINMDNDSFSNEIDLLFINDGKKSLNFSTSLYDTDRIIGKLLNVYDESRCVHNLLIDGEVYSILIQSNEIISAKTGRIEGKVYVGKILNDNMGFLNKIKNRTDITALSFVFDNNILATTYSPMAKELDIIKNINQNLAKNDIYNKDKFIYSKLPLNCYERFTGLYIVPVIKSTSFDILQSNNDKQIIGLILFFAFITLVIFLMVNNFVISPMKVLLEFAKNIKDTKEKSNQNFMISEYNILASGLEDIISQLRDVKEQYTLAVEGTQDGLWDWDISSNEIFFSNRCKEMVGYENDEIEMDIQTWQSFICEEDRKRVNEQLILHLKQKSDVFEEEFRARCKDGSFKWLKARAKALYNENQRAYRMLGFFSDIDVLKNLEEENQKKEAYILEQSKMSAMGDMLSNIAHQWRQPLSVITTVVSGIKVTLELDLFDKEDIIKDLDVVSGTSQKLSKTIDSFRETYEYGHKKEDFDIKELLEKDINILKPAYSYQRIAFESNLEAIDFYGYKDELLLVFNKLIQNSKDAILKNEIKDGLIVIDLFLKEDFIYLTIKDNALGVDEEIKEKIFEPYFTTKHQAQGVGLSLYVARNVLSKYFNGKIMFSNTTFEYESKQYSGAEFIVCFPLKSHQI